MKSEIFRYSQLLDAVKIRIRQAQVKATLSANAEMILMYWDIGRIIAERQKSEGWGAGVIPRLSKDIRNELPEVKGFSERNIGYMMRFAREYSMPLILQQPVAKISSEVRLESQIVVPLHEKDIMKNLQRLVAKIPWGHNILLMQKIKDLPTRLWYIRQAIENGWSRDVLGMMIKSEAHNRQGTSVTNFSTQLPSPQSDMAQQALKDPYIFDFLTLTEPFQERELEAGLVQHLEKFLIGQMFLLILAISWLLWRLFGEYFKDITDTGQSSGTPMILCVSHLEVDQKTIHNHLGKMPGLAKSPKADLSKGFTVVYVAEKLSSPV